MHKERLVLGARSMPGNPYDEHMLAEALEYAETLSGARPQITVADCDHRVVAVESMKNELRVLFLELPHSAQLRKADAPYFFFQL